MIVSDLTPTTSPNNHRAVISLIYFLGNSAMVLDTLTGAQDLNEVRERNKKKKGKGIEASNKYKQAKAVIVMFHFQKFGYKIGKTALKARPLEPLVFDNDLVKSVNEVSHDTPIIENDPIERPEGNETMVSI